MLVGKRQGEVVRHTPREVHIVFGKASWFAREEEQRPEHGAAERNSHTERGTRANHAKQPAANRLLRNLAVDVVDDVRLAVEQRSLDRRQQRRGPERFVGHVGARHRVHLERKTVLRPRRQRQDVVRQRGPNSLRELRKNLTDVECLGNGLQKTYERIDALAPPQLRRANRIVIEGQRNQVAYGL